MKIYDYILCSGSGNRFLLFDTLRSDLSGLNIAAFNVGIAQGSIVGGQTVERYGLAQTPWIGAMIVLVALLLVVLSGRLDKLPRRSAALSPEG